MIGDLIGVHQGVATPTSEEDVQLLLRVLAKVQELCNGLPQLPEEMARNRDTFTAEIIDALNRYRDATR